MMGKISENGDFTKKCQSFFQQRYGFKKALLTTSCTDALEMCALLANMNRGNEVIIPSYTFVSTALAFVRTRCKHKICRQPVECAGMDEEEIESLISERTKAIVPVHYAGIACDLDIIMDLANRYNLLVIEDAAQAIESKYKDKPLGSIGHMAAFSFHKQKISMPVKVVCWLLMMNNFLDHSEIISGKKEPIVLPSSVMRLINMDGWM
ncbi:MAG: aminotransferase class V-fold PLP-dependent enzyme [Balneolaceae bacterium]|nr:aminotransferase class V-fold PLP-dependent enzyme [Balneolaceae bacterium]